MLPLILALAFYIAFIPHQNYPYPLHIDEWVHMARSEAIMQTGSITNRSSFGYASVDLTAIALAADNQIVGISKTFVSNLDVGQQSGFLMEWPAPAVPTQRVIITAAANIFQSSNILPLQGDPGNLR